MKPRSWIILVILFIVTFQLMVMADVRESGLYGNLGGTLGGGIKTTLGYRYEVIPGTGLFILNEISGFTYLPGYVLAINPGFTYKSSRGGYYGFKYGLYIVDSFNSTVHNNYSTSGCSIYAGIENDLSFNRKLMLESGMHFIYTPYTSPSMFYISIGYALNQTNGNNDWKELSLA